MNFRDTISLSANIIEILVGLSAIIVAWTQRKKISAAFSILFNYSMQASLGDLRHWLEKLQENSVDDDNVSKKVRTSLAYIFGKIKGNPHLYKHFGDKILKRLRIMMDDLDEGKPVKETDKLSLCSEIKESLTTLEIDNYKSKKYE